MASIGGIGRAFASAIFGIRQAGDVLSKSAATLASTSAADPVTLSPAARAIVSAGPPAHAGDVAGAMVNLDVARATNSANVSVLRTIDDMSRDLEGIVAPDRNGK